MIELNSETACGFAADLIQELKTCKMSITLLRTRCNNNASVRGNSRLMHLERRLLGGLRRIVGQFCRSRRRPLRRGRHALELAWRGDAAPGVASGIPFTDEQQLAEIRGQCRALAAGNEFAINGHENRISYIVGSGHVYRAVARKGQTAAGIAC